WALAVADQYRRAVTGFLAGVAPTLTSATLVRSSRPAADSKNSDHGTPHGLMGSEASMIPIPGMITASCRLTQAAVRPMSNTFPSTLSPALSGPPGSLRADCHWM